MTKAREAACIHGENGASEDLSQHSMDIGRDPSANPQARGDTESHLDARALLEWPSIACEISKCGAGRYIHRKRVYTKENAYCRYHCWIEGCCECENALQDERVSKIAIEGDEVLKDHTFGGDHTTTPPTAGTNAVNACFSGARFPIGDIRIEAETTNAGPNRAVFPNTQNESGVQEKGKAKFTKQVGEEDLAPPKNILKSIQPSKSAKRGVAIKSQTHIAKDPPPFAGVPLHPHFPKTPLAFYNGEIQVKETTMSARKIDKGVARGSERGNGVVLTENNYRAQKGKKSFNPFKGMPLPLDFPKTPLNFYRGEVVAKTPRSVDVSALMESRLTARAITRTVSRCDGRESVMQKEQIVIINESDQDEGKEGDERYGVVEKKSGVGWMLNSESVV